MSTQANIAFKHAIFPCMVMYAYQCVGVCVCGTYRNVGARGVDEFDTLKHDLALTLIWLCSLRVGAVDIRCLRDNDIITTY